MPLKRLRDITPMRERHPVHIGVAGLLIIALIAIATSQVQALPLIGGGPKYAAEFTEVGGLKKGDDVRLAGVLVGEVDDLQLRGDTVRVVFRIKDRHDREALGTRTGASVRIKSLLGTMYMSLEPEGGGTLKKGSVIPTTRTTPPYDIVQAFSGLTNTTQAIDTDQLADALSTIDEVSRQTPEQFQQAVRGVTELSENLAERDREIKTLLENLDGLSGVLADRNAEFAKLFQDGSVLFTALQERRDAIHAVLVGVTQMSNQINGLIAETRADLKPALTRLSNVVTVLRENEQNIDDAIEMLPTYYSLVANGAAGAPWLEGYIFNLLELLGVEG